MRRRDFIQGIAGSAATWPLGARAQQPTMPVIGFIHPLSPEKVPHFVAGLHQGLGELGFVEGKNIAVEYRWAYGQYDRLPELAAELVDRKVVVIAAVGGSPSPQIVEAATRTIPIVFTSNGDPVTEGLVPSLAQPGGNATGVTIFGTAAVAKRMQLLHEVVPHASVIGFLMNPTNPNGNIELKAAQAAAGSRNCLSLRPAARPKSKLRSQVWPNSGVARFSAPPTRFYLGSATELSLWQPIIGYPRSTTYENSPRLVA